MISSIIGIAFDCPNANELADFYVKLFGWKKEISSDEWAGIRTPEGILFVFQTVKESSMRTNIVLNDELVNEAFKYSQTISTKRELIEMALKEYVNNRKRKNIKELRGKIKFRDDYDYKSMRQ